MLNHKYLGGWGSVLVCDREYNDVGLGLKGHWVEDELSDWKLCSGIRGSIGSRGSLVLLMQQQLLVVVDAVWLRWLSEKNWHF